MAPIPQTIVGHDETQKQLEQDLAHGNIAHAYLFTGPKHIGKMTIARWFAARILTIDRSPEEAAAITHAMERLIHPDFLTLDQLWIDGVQDDWAAIGAVSNVPQHHRAKKPTAKSDVISIDDVRALSLLLHGTGTSPHFVCVIRSIERMHQESASAFLKMLEEPPERVVFLLTAESSRTLLPTIVSRTRVVPMRKVSRDDMRSMLTTVDDDAEFALHRSDGAPGLLRRLMDDVDELRRQKQLHGQARQFWHMQTPFERIAWLMPFAEPKAPLHDAILHLGLTLREHPDPEARAAFEAPFAALTKGLETNANRGLLLERFGLSLTQS